jgi:hypothetical protein
MAEIKDQFGNYIQNLNKIGGGTLVDSRPATVNLAALNAEVVTDISGEAFAAFDVRGTFVATLTPSYSIDGVNFIDLPIFVRSTESFALNATAVGAYFFEIPIGTRKIRVRATAYTSGTAIVALSANKGLTVGYSKNIPTNLCVTTTGAIGAAVTATIPAATGLHHYITQIRIERFAGALLTAAAAPVVVTTTNLPGSRAYSIDASAAAQGTLVEKRDMTVTPIKSTAAGTATTIVAPATTNVIWRITVDYYLGL